MKTAYLSVVSGISFKKWFAIDLHGRFVFTLVSHAYPERSKSWGFLYLLVKKNHVL